MSDDRTQKFVDRWMRAYFALVLVILVVGLAIRLLWGPSPTLGDAWTWVIFGPMIVLLAILGAIRVFDWIRK
jgi:hypothetical protein